MTGQDILPDISSLTISTFIKQFIIILIIVTILFNFPKKFTIINPTRPSNLSKIKSKPLPTPASNYGQNLTIPILKKQTDSKTSSYNLIDHSQLELVSVVLVVQDSRDWESKGILPFTDTLNHLFNYPYLKEFIIWNNDLNTHLKIQDYQFLYDDLITHDPIIRIFNPPGNLSTSMSQHISCSLAAYETCYFNDEETIHPNLDSLYTKYIETNSRTQFPITATTNSVSPDTDPRDLKGLITNSVLFPKQLSTRYLRQLSYLSEEDPSSNENSFSIWVNRPINQLLIQPLISNTSIPSTQTSPHAFNVLERVLNTYDPMISPDPFPLSIPNTFKDLETDEVGKVASLDDKVLLFTSEALDDQMIKAIDADLNTCWKLDRVDHRKRFVGLNFVIPVTNLNSLEIILNPLNQLTKLDYQLEFLQSNSTNWEKMDENRLEDNKLLYKALGNHLNGIKKIKFSLINDEQFEICGWIVNDDWIL